MNSIDLYRLFLLAKKQILEEWKRQSILFAAIVIIFTILLRTLSFVHNATFPTDNTLGNLIVVIFYIILMFLCFIVLSYQTAHAMPFMVSKQKQIQYNLLPASKSEKFVLAILLPILISFIQCVIAVPLADLIQYIWSGEFTTPLCANMSFEYSEFMKQNSQVPAFLSNNNNPAKTLVVSGILYHAWSLFSASIFRKHPFLLSTVTYMIGSAIISSIITIPLGFFKVHVTSETFMVATNVNLAISIILSIAFYIAAYRRMSTAQV